MQSPPAACPRWQRRQKGVPHFRQRIVNALRPRQRPSTATASEGDDRGTRTKRLSSAGSSDVRRRGRRPCPRRFLPADALRRARELRPHLVRGEARGPPPRSRPCRTSRGRRRSCTSPRPRRSACDARLLGGLVLEPLQVGERQVVVEGRRDLGRRRRTRRPACSARWPPGTRRARTRGSRGC